MGTYYLSVETGTPVSFLTRDPATIVHVQPYIGILSTLGIMLWAAATALCLGGAALLPHDSRRHRTDRFLLFSGLFTLFLMLDDAFLFHEELFPRILHIPEIATYLGYVAITVAYLAWFADLILLTDYLLLLLAFLFLGVSTAMDQLLPFSDFGTFVEDSFKFAGIILWLAYFSHTAAGMIRAEVASSRKKPLRPPLA